MDKLFRTKDGDIVIWQKPNWQLLAALIAIFLRYLDIAGSGDFFNWAAQALLVYWALEEVFSGVNLFRRALGIAVFVIVLINNL